MCNLSYVTYYLRLQTNHNLDLCFTALHNVCILQAFAVFLLLCARIGLRTIVRARWNFVTPLVNQSIMLHTTMSYTASLDRLSNPVRFDLVLLASNTEKVASFGTPEAPPPSSESSISLFCRVLPFGRLSVGQAP